LLLSHLLAAMLGVSKSKAKNSQIPIENKFSLIEGTDMIPYKKQAYRYLKKVKSADRFSLKYIQYKIMFNFVRWN
jgi:hypothetical protein